jgi:hypothetical protein
VAGVTVSCTSTIPPPPVIAPNCLALAATTLAGRPISLRPCGADRYELVDRPAHGTVALTLPYGPMLYRPADGFVGDDAFTFVAVRASGIRSAVMRYVVTVRALAPKPAAPKLTLVGRSRLDRRGRVVVRAICDRACQVKLRVRVRLPHGHNLDGRAVRASAPANGTVVLRLRRAATKRHILGARVLGRIVGADGRTRPFSLTL